MDTTTLDNPPIALEECLPHFSEALDKLFKTHKGKTNLLPHQQQALRMLQQQQTFLIVPCNKNLGPAIIECHKYIKIAMQDHLNDTTTYKSLTSSETDCYALDIRKQILCMAQNTQQKVDENGMCFHPGGTQI